VLLLAQCGWKMKTSTLFTHALYSNIFNSRGAIENKQNQQKYSIIWIF